MQFPKLWTQGHQASSLASLVFFISRASISYENPRMYFSIYVTLACIIKMGFLQPQLDSLCILTIGKRITGSSVLVLHVPLPTSQNHAHLTYKNQRTIIKVCLLSVRKGISQLPNASASTKMKENFLAAIHFLTAYYLDNRKSKYTGALFQTLH